MQFSKEKLTLILGYYIFDNQKNNNKYLSKFAIGMNTMFNMEVSKEVITYYLSLFKSIDPSFNINRFKNIDKAIQEIWNYYISEDRINDLKII